MSNMDALSLFLTLIDEELPKDETVKRASEMLLKNIGRHSLAIHLAHGFVHREHNRRAKDKVSAIKDYVTAISHYPERGSQIRNELDQI